MRGFRCTATGILVLICLASLGLALFSVFRYNGYVLQIAQHLEFAPSWKYLIDPAINPSDDRVWLLDTRLRFTF